MMLGRFHWSIRALPVALFFPSYSMSTLRNSTNLFTQSSAEGNVTSSNVNSNNDQGDDNTSSSSEVSFSSVTKNNNSPFARLQKARTSTSKGSNTSIVCSKQSDLGKEYPSPSVDKLLESRVQQDEEISYITDYKGMLEELSLPTSFGKQESSKSRNGSRNKKSKYQKRCTALEPFDLYQSDSEDAESNGSETENFVFSRSSREDEDNAEEVKVDGLIEEPLQIVLRPGMVLLKKYISPSQQVSIVKKCRELGLGPGGFYHPGYKDGAKLRLRMMCLGMDWDPQTRKYQKRRLIDRVKPPEIPSEFHLLITRAMQDALSLIKEDSKFCNAEEILPQMTPDICIVNFYTETGRLGLHQDRDESVESLSNGLPVVSISIGDAAEFLYGDQRDTKKAEKLVLKSGDVLIFGGESRHVFHGINSIIRDSAPLFLLEHTRLRPGRLNLTFRKY